MTEDGLLNAENLTSYNLFSIKKMEQGKFWRWRQTVRKWTLQVSITHTILIQNKDNGSYNIIGAIIRSQKPKLQMITGSYINKSRLLITELNFRKQYYNVETSQVLFYRIQLFGYYITAKCRLQSRNIIGAILSNLALQLLHCNCQMRITK